MDDAGGIAADPAGAGDPADGEDGAAESGAQEEDQAGKDDEPAALTGAPEGEYEIALPEGMTLDKGALDEITPLAKELNLSNAGLAKLATDALPIAEKMFTRSNVEAVVATRKAWETDGRAYVQGGKLSDGTEIEPNAAFAGETMDTVLANSAKFIDRFTSDESGEPILFPGVKLNAETGEMEPGTFRDFLKITGLGNHPAMLFIGHLAGAAISEDSDFHRHGTTPQTKLTREDRYYGNSRPKT